MATRPAKEDPPIFPSLPIPITPIPQVPPEKVFLLFLLFWYPPLSRSSRLAIFEDLFTFHFIHFCFSRLKTRQALLCTSLCPLGILLRVVLSAITALLNSPTPSLRFLHLFSHFLPSKVDMTRVFEFLRHSNKGIWLLALAERPCVFPI